MGLGVASSNHSRWTLGSQLKIRDTSGNGGDLVLLHLNDSNNERLLIWKGAIKAWKVHPWFGWGLDNFLGAFRANRGLAYLDTPAIHGSETNMQGDAHNLILQVMTTTGLAGLAVSLILLYRLWYFLEDRKHRSEYHRAVRACVYGLLAASMVEPVPFTCWCLVAMLLGSIA